MKNLIIAFCTMATLSVACKSKSSADEIGIAKQATIDSVNAVNNARQQVIDSVNLEKIEQAKQEKANGSRLRSGGSSSSGSSASTSSPATTQQKKGWSSTAKGAVIGAGAGALTGALVSKQKGTGAIVGGVLGAGAGAATGAIIDKNKKKKQQQ